LSERVGIIEKVKVPSGATLIFGFPDVGLVGVIAASYLVEELNLAEVAYLESKILPPLVVLHNGLPHSSIRIFGNEKILLTIAEVPIPVDAVYPVMDALIEWGKSKNVKMMISLGGIPLQDRQDSTELKSFAAASSPEALKLLQDKNVEPLAEGYIVGPQAIMLQSASNMDTPALALLSQCFYNYPDPEAAAEVLKDLIKIVDVKVDVTKLLEKGEEIRLRARDVMKRTQEEMGKMKKGQELDIPMYVS
jgi:uncharacterized protein